MEAKDLEALNIVMFAKALPVHISGGMEFHVWALAKGIVERGHKLTIVTTRHPQGKKFEEKDGIEIHYVGNRIGRYQRLPINIAKLYQGDLFCTFAKESLSKFKELDRDHKFDVVHSQSMTAWAVTDHLKREKTPLVTTLHGTTLTELFSYLRRRRISPSLPKVSLKLLYYFLSLDVPIIHGSDSLITVSEELREHVVKLRLRDRENIKVIPNGIDTNRFRPDIKSDLIKEKLNLKGDEKIILTVGHLIEEKGVQFIIQVLPKILKKVKDARLLVVGTGTYINVLKKIVNELDLETFVYFVGHVSDEDLPKYYNICDVFVMPTIRIEGFPLVLLEAMACEKPVIASRIGGIPSAIDHGVGGILIPPGDAHALYRHVIKFLEDQEFEEIGKNARRTVLEKFSVGKMLKDTIKVYEKVLG